LESTPYAGIRACQRICGIPGRQRWGLQRTCHVNQLRHPRFHFLSERVKSPFQFPLERDSQTKPLPMLHFEPSWVPASCHLGSPISCAKFLFPTHLSNKKLLRCALHCLETRPTTLLGTLKNPNPFSCFVLTLPKSS